MRNYQSYLGIPEAHRKRAGSVRDELFALLFPRSREACRFGLERFHKQICVSQPTYHEHSYLPCSELVDRNQ